MKVIGVIGGVASGKSAVGEALARWGAARFDADRAGHQALQDPQAVAKIVDRWGPGVLDEAGQVSRGAVAARVFRDDDRGRADRRFLESLTHPLIRREFRQFAEAAAAEGAPALVVDAALLLEADWDRWCDVVLYVDAPGQLRLQRAASRGWTREQWSAREHVQLPLEEKRRRATHQVSNDGTLQELEERLAVLARQWGLRPR